MRLLIAGGGTGGHLYPGLAIAEEVKARGGEALFVGTTRGLEARVVPAAGHPLELLEVSGLKRVGGAALARGLLRLPAAFARSIAIVRRFRPDAVLGVGGYASGPVVLAAALLRYPTAVQEQNSAPGFTNRRLGRFVRRVFIAFDGARAYFPAAKIEFTGNPVRRAFLEAPAARGQAGPGDAGPRPRVLVVGGSQGARAVNDLVVGAAAALAARGALPALAHQTGAADEARVREAYGRAGLAGAVEAAPFIDDMAGALGAADLVIARAGALTLAELAIVGRPAILIPLPTAADDHQSKNAAAFAGAGAAVVLPQPEATADRLAGLVADLLADAPRRRAMAAAMRTLARPDAARAIVDGLEAIARR
jgi:UDP-N-acetylglucosamine--N-acetylmuramyl-(pentapeptide) pyrophosphoryl-undecaprenol N-acetylglucosamine transferase